MFHVNILNMKTKLSIYVRDHRLYLSKPIVANGKTVYKRVSTGLENTEENLHYVKQMGDRLWNELTKELNKEMTFEEFLPHALEHINGLCKAETANDRVAKITKYILPTFKQGKLAKIRSRDVENWQLAMVQNHGVDLTRRCKQLLHRIFERAVVEDLVTRNPLEGTATLREPKQKLREVYTKEEVGQILQNANGWLRVFILLLATAGLRTGEAAALKREDVNLRTRSIKVTKSLRRGNINPPKGDERVVDIGSLLFEALSEYLSCYHGKWLFSPNGGEKPFYDGANINKRHFQPLLKRLGIRYKSLYSLRHTFATMQLSGGNDLVYVSQQLGHREVGTTSKFYIKYLKNSESIKKSDEIFHF